MSNHNTYKVAPRYNSALCKRKINLTVITMDEQRYREAVSTSSAGTDKEPPAPAPVVAVPLPVKAVAVLGGIFTGAEKAWGLCFKTA